MAPVDPILGTTLAYRADPDPRKVDVGVGAYRTDESQPYVFKVVRKAEKEIVDDLTVNKEYLPIDGLADFNRLAQELVFGKENPLVKEKKIVTSQSISGTGSLRVGFEFVRTFLPADVYVPKPTWGNHIDIIERSGLKPTEYPYYNPKTRGLDLQGMLNSLGNAKPGSVVLLHACAHNPTGVDPSEQEWDQIMRLMKEKRLVPFLDLAYPAFASGDFNKDTEVVRKFAAMGFQMFVAQSFAKILGLYSERLGAIHVIAASKDGADRVLSQMKRIMRAMYSNPPAHGARIFVKIFSNPVLK
jgi:aspartate/tyrosine/aromatic aminotransferase